MPQPNRLRFVIISVLAAVVTGIQPINTSVSRGRVLIAAAAESGSGTSAGTAEGTSDVPTSVFNLAKTILGAGILSLPSGVAAFTDDVSGLVPATGLLLAMGLISAYSFASIGRACRQHNSRSFADAWAKSVGPKSAVVISSVITFKTFFSCLAFSIIIGDSFSSIFKSFGLPALMTSRTNVILGLTSLVIFPLCMLKNMDALKTTSLLGLGGIVYCALFMVVRLLDGSYRAGGKFFNDIADAVKPSFCAKKAPVPIQQVFVLISMISTAYVAHYNAPKFWTDLKNKSTHRFHTVVVSAFGFACLMYMTVMWTGFLTFGGNSTGFILNNYSSKDHFATFARLSIGLAILFGYPLVFTALREGFFDLLGVSTAGDERAKKRIPVTLGLMGAITAISLVLKNLGLVVSFSGALIGAMLIYTVPAVMNIYNLDALSTQARRSQAQVKSGDEGVCVGVEAAANYAMAVMGCVIAVIGVTTTLMNSGGAH